MMGQLDLNALLSTFATIGKVLFGIGFVIFVHELGHFLAAKFCGVKCDKFYVGFDVPRWSLLGLPMPTRIAAFQWGETEYGIGLIPLGGYVKMLGQDDNPANAAKEAERIRTRAAEEGVPPQSLLDPRSYPAKKVPQRMLIISAGILMNLIFAVIMAAVAYRMGISYLTCEIAGVTPGDPAWESGIRTGDKIVQIGKSGEPAEHLRFDKDLTIKVLSAGLGMDEPSPIDVLVRAAGEEPRWARMTPRFRGKGETRRATLGVLAPRSTTLAPRRPVLEYGPAGQASPPLEAGDRIIAVDGRPLDRAAANERGDLPAFELDRVLSALRAKPVTLTVERREGGIVRSVDSVVPPSPVKWLGVSMTIGPIVAVQADSPAAKGGVRKGDVLVSVQGEPIGDPLTLPERCEAIPPGPLRLGIMRRETHPATSGSERTSPADGGQGEPIEVTVERRTGVVTSPLFGMGGYVAIDSIGIAFDVAPLVARVEPGSEAASQGLVAGDRVVAVQILAKNEDANAVAVEWLGKKYSEIVELDEMNNWVSIHGGLQELPPDLEVRLIARRDGRESTISVSPMIVPGSYDVERGLVLTSFQRTHVASAWGEAFRLGGRETKERLGEVASVLGLLVRGRLSMNNLGGPIRIAAVAGHEAAQGVSRLLIFLTFLSANLALLNALPIPVLDGGHLMFLFVEAVIRRPVPEKWQNGLTFVGLACLLALMLFVVANDVRWLFL